VGSTVPRRQG